jgi:pyruvate,water dikinase
MIRRLFGREKQRRPSAQGQIVEAFRVKYANFQTLLASNAELLSIIADIEVKLHGRTVFGGPYIEAQTARAVFHCARMIHCLEMMSGKSEPGLRRTLERIQNRIKAETGNISTHRTAEYILPYATISRAQVESVGEKNANLCEAANRIGLPIPRGFAITTAAFDRFISHNRLEGTIARLKQRLDVIETETVVQVSEEIQKELTGAEIPPDLAAALQDAYRNLKEAAAPRTPLNISMRSSALGEDSSLSFAGQYLTRLNVPPQRMPLEYKKIVASLFTPRAISYRLHMGIPFKEAAMAVACQEMIAASASGVMYTRNPVNPLDDRILINAVWGLGPFAVDGVVPPDTFLLEKSRPPRLVDSSIADKSARLAARPDGELAEESVGADRRTAPCLTPDQAESLADFGLRLESHFGAAQDVEWALDGQGRLVVLQTRPLRIDALEAGKRTVQSEPVPGFEMLIDGGDIACVGVAGGPAFPIRTEADLVQFPDGGVIVSARSSPQLVMAMGKCRAIVTDSGNIAGHMASLAREYMVPTILNTGDATSRIPAGCEVTVDAYNARVYRGRVPALVKAGFERGGFMRNTPVYQTLRRRADLIVPLNLLDPRSPAFTPTSCRTIHDIMRYIHETSYAEIFQLGDLVTDRANLSVRLKVPIPIDLYVIDLGGGLSVDAAAVSSVTGEQLVSVPLKALIRGMLHEGLRSFEPRPVNLGGFLSVMSRQLFSPPTVSAERFGDRSYAIISDRYLNFSSRVGYHYSILDCYCGKTPAKNYINFEFKGGAADDRRRNRRARLIERVLAGLGFLVRTTGDRVTARFAKVEAEEIERVLDQVGRLLIFTRQLDMLMHSEELVQQMADSFLNADYGLLPGPVGPGSEEPKRPS